MGFKRARPEIETAIPYANHQTAHPNHRIPCRSRHSLLFLSGSYSPLGSSALGSYLPNVLGNQSALYSSLQNSIVVSLPVGLLPFGVAGATGLIVYTVVQRVLGGTTRATYSAPRTDPS